MRRRIGVITVCAGLALVVACVRLLAPVPLEVLDRKLLDFRYLVRGPLAASSHVVIVGDRRGAASPRVGRWPWPRARLAQLIDRLHDAGVRAIGLDIVFDEPATSVDRAELETALAANPHRTAEELRRALHAELDDDAQLATALRRAGDVVLAHFFEFGGRSGRAARDDAAPGDDGDADGRRDPRHHARAQAWRPGCACRSRCCAAATAGTGHINFAPDPDGSYRRVPIGIRAGDRLASVARPRAAPRVSRRGRRARHHHAGGCHRGPDR